MPNPITMPMEDYDTVLKEIDFWMEVADEPIKVQKGEVLKFVNQLDEEVELPVIGGFGSSGLIDADKDVFHPSALDDIVKTAKFRMSTWRNHKFTVPDDAVGFIADTEDGTRGLAVATDVRDKALSEQARQIAQAYGGPDVSLTPDTGIVRIKSTVNTAIPQAVGLYRAMLNGSQWGWSIGCKYTEARRRTDTRGAIKGFDVLHLSTKEFSVVSLPSNPLAWADVARKCLIQKGELPPGPRDFEYGLVVKDLDRLVNESYTFKHWSDLDPGGNGMLTDEELERAAIAKMLRDVGEVAKKYFGITWAHDPAVRRNW